MRKINLIVIHCSATRTGSELTPKALEQMHRDRGFDGTGYHYYIRRSGEVTLGRPLEKMGAHAKGHNAYSIGICYEGGLDHRGQAQDTRTTEQCLAMACLIRLLLFSFPGSRVCGHRDLSPDLNGNGIIEPHEWLKQCPCFDAARFWMNSQL